MTTEASSAEEAFEKLNLIPQPGEPKQWQTLAEVEADHVRRVLDHTKGNKQAALRLLGVDRKTIERMIVRHGINIKHKIEIE